MRRLLRLLKLGLSLCILSATRAADFGACGPLSRPELSRAAAQAAAVPVERYGAVGDGNADGVEQKGEHQPAGRGASRGR